MACFGCPDTLARCWLTFVLTTLHLRLQDMHFASFCPRYTDEFTPSDAEVVSTKAVGEDAMLRRRVYVSRQSGCFSSHLDPEIYVLLQQLIGCKDAKRRQGKRPACCVLKNFLVRRRHIKSKAKTQYVQVWCKEISRIRRSINCSMLTAHQMHWPCNYT